MSLERALRNPDRKFFAETVIVGDCNVHVIATEHEERYLLNKHQEIIPSDWQQRIEQTLAETNCLFIEYFPPDIQSRMKGIPFLGEIISNYMERDIDSMYGKIIQYAADHDIPIAVSDPANTEFYLPYEIVSGWPQMFRSFLRHLPQLRRGDMSLDEALEGETYSPGKEKMSNFPHATEARRLFTAIGIQEYVRVHPELKDITLITAPAHARRILNILKNGLDSRQSRNAAIYKKVFVGVEKSVRVYAFIDGKWERKNTLPLPLNTG